MFEQWKKMLDKKSEQPEEIPFRAPDQIEAPSPAAQQTQETTALPQSTPTKDNKSDNVELRVMRPASYEEVGSIADNLLAGCTVVINFELLSVPVMVKMLDFLNGVTYCTEGEIKQVAKTTFIVTPHSNVDISDL